MATSRLDGDICPLAITMGEPAGVGGELTLKAWMALRTAGPCFFALDDPDRLSGIATRLGWTVPVRTIDTPEEAADFFSDALPVLPIPLPARATPGRPSAATASAVITSIEQGVAHTLSGAASGLVTQPIQKSALYAAGFRHPGHTEFVAELSGAITPPVMMLAGPEMRTVPATVHIPLKDVADVLDEASLAQTVETVARSLRSDFGIRAPRVAVAGLNPHAGEDGTLGMEDREIITPALERAGAACSWASIIGPFPADTLFHAEARAGYDAVVAMYHDQALIPVKTLDFHRTVNVTLGLPIIRTSPDHGTALDLAGTGTARVDSVLAALELAADFARHRQASPE